MFAWNFEVPLRTLAEERSEQVDLYKHCLNTSKFRVQILP